MLKPFAFASTVAAVLASTAVARADFATPPGDVAIAEPHRVLAVAAPPPARDQRAAVADDKTGILAVRLEGGPAWATSRLRGGYGRLTVEALYVPNAHGASPVFGIWEGIEGWGAPFRVAGVSVPIVGEVGFRTPVVIGTVGAGLNVISFEQLGDQKGVGGFQPRASARLGLHFDPVYVVATGDVQRRWQTNIPAMNMFQVGLAVGVALDMNKMK